VVAFSRPWYRFRADDLSVRILFREEELTKDHDVYTKVFVEVCEVWYNIKLELIGGYRYAIYRSRLNPDCLPTESYITDPI
jgi:hypothetical protein